MEGDFLWSSFCKTKNYPKNFSEFQKLYPTLSIEEIDGLLENQIQEFERTIFSSKVDVNITMNF